MSPTIAAGYLAEILPSKNRGRWLVSAFSLQAAGILLGAVVGVVVLNLLPEISSWRILLGFGVVPALVIIWLRRTVPESPRWLAQNGHEQQAREVGRALCGFAVMTVALCLLAVSGQLPGGSEAHLGLVAVGFILFNTFMNAGPNATTFTLPAEVFPSEMRAAGHGFAAAAGKFGAALGTFLFPVLLDSVGQSALLYGIAFTTALGFVVTLVLRIEPRGRSLDEMAGVEIARVAPRVIPP